MAKEGSTVSGLMDSFATAISLALQHGVPLRVLCEKFAHTRFEPSGWTGNPEIGYAKSIMDYIFRWIQIRFLSGHQLDLFTGLAPASRHHPRSRRHHRPRLRPSSRAGRQASPQMKCHPPTKSEDLPLPSERRRTIHYTTPPQQGIAPDLAASSGLDLVPSTQQPVPLRSKTAASTMQPTP